MSDPIRWFNCKIKPPKKYKLGSQLKVPPVVEIAQVVYKQIYIPSAVSDLFKADTLLVSSDTVSSDIIMCTLF